MSEPSGPSEETHSGAMREPDTVPALDVVTVTTAAEMSDVLVVRRAVFIEEQGISEDEEIDRYDGDPREMTSAVYVLGRLQGRPVATARLLLDQPAGDFPHIGRVAVLRELRGRHYGVAVMRALETEARARGCGGITLAAQTYALGFYEQLGYVARGDVFLDAGIDHRWMDLRFERPAAGAR